MSYLLLPLFLFLYPTIIPSPVLLSSYLWHVQLDLSLRPAHLDVSDHVLTTIGEKFDKHDPPR